MQLSGSNVVVTGAGSGLGEAAARRLAREGARVVVSDINEQAAGSVAHSIDPSGSRAVGLRCDVASGSDCALLVEAAERFFGAPIDIFLANAGVSFAGDFLETSEAVIRRTIEVNVIGTSLSAQAALRSLVRSAHASLLITSSMSGVQARAKRSVYTASKHALVGLVKALALEFGPQGVRVNAIAPGPTDTPFLRAHLAKVSGDVEQAVAQAKAGLPLGWLPTPEDFADAVVFLVSPAARSITGHTLLLDCGATAGKM